MTCDEEKDHTPVLSVGTCESSELEFFGKRHLGMTV